MLDEPFIYDELDSRLTMYPIRRQNLWELYLKSRACFWSTEEVNLTNDLADYNKLTPVEQNLVDHVLAFFASADSLVNMNLLSRFTNEVKFIEAQAFYAQQIAMEVIHSEMYSKLIDAMIIDQNKRDKLYNSIKNMPVIAKMADYIIKCTESTEKFGSRLLRMACVEGIYFRGCFRVIYWLSSRGLMPGLAQSNELIDRDESLHTLFALELYKMLVPEHRPSHDEINNIFREACDLSFEFVQAGITDNMREMNQLNMRNYIEFTTDNLLSYIDMPKLYNSSHDQGFMIKINLLNRTNFFERRISEYSGPMPQKNPDYITYNF